MGWWPFGRGGDLSASKLPDGSSSKQQQQPKAAAAGVTTAASAAAASAEPAGAAARPTSVFAFGPTVAPGGEVLRGMCAGDDPDAIQACTWTIERASEASARQQGGGKGGGGRAHAYVVEF